MDYHPTCYLSNLQTHGNPSSSRKFHSKRLYRFQDLYTQNLYAHYGCVNAVEFSEEDGRLLASGGDDKRVLLWNVSKSIFRSSYQPVAMNATHFSNIFCLAFSHNDERLLSAGNDEQVIIHDLQTLQPRDVYSCDTSVYGLSPSPENNSLIATACEDGSIYIIDTRLATADKLRLAQSRPAFHSAMFSPVQHNLISTAHSKDGVELWDVRVPLTPVFQYGDEDLKDKAMSARFNTSGSQLVCLRRRLPLILYNVEDKDHIAELDSEGYANSCTMKSCCYAGDKDQYVVSGSDDFGVYVWKIPKNTEEHHQTVKKSIKVLKGHRSVVNQVRYDSKSNMLVTSGVEKYIKLWSTEPLPIGEEAETSGPRKRYSHNQYLHLILESGRALTHDYETENTEEDLIMLAFFDSLIQNELNDSDATSSDSDKSESQQRASSMEEYNFETDEDDLIDDPDEDSSDSSVNMQPQDRSSTSEAAASSATTEKMKTRIRNLRQSLKNIECSLSNEETIDVDLVSDSEQSSTSSLCSSAVQENVAGNRSDKDYNENVAERPESSSAVSQGNAKRKTKTAMHKLKEKKKRKYVTKRLNQLSTASDDSDSSDNLSSSTRQKNANRCVKKKIACSVKSTENTVSRTNQNNNHDCEKSNGKMETNFANDESKPNHSENNNSLEANVDGIGELVE